MEYTSEFTGFDGENIFEPLLAYKNVYKDLFHKNTTEYFDSLVEKSQIDIEANRETNRKIKKHESERNEVVKKISKQNALRGFLIFLIVAGLAAAIVGIIMLVQGTQSLLAPILMIVFGFALPILFIVLIVVIINKKLKELRGMKAKIDKIIEDLLKEAWAQMAPLNELFTRGMGISLFRKTIPIINLDKMFDTIQRKKLFRLYLNNKKAIIQLLNKKSFLVFVC
ncbi:MAG TPA: hypothetical protein PLY58_04145 [Bacilli bacterium]|nr:hypothetical protein [Bacilli bacterium]